MIIEEGLIAIGILALVAAMFVLRGKGKASQSKQQAVYEPAVNKQVVDLARPSVSPKAQGMGSVSAGNGQVAGITESAVSATTEMAFSVPTADKQAGAFVEPSQTTETLTQVAFPMQSTTVVAQTPVAPFPPLKPGSSLFPNSLSINQQMAELIAETWALQQQVAEIGCRLNYLNTCIQRSLVSTPNEPDNTSRGEN